MPETNAPGTRAIRRIVTGDGKDGRPEIASDGGVAAIETPLMPRAKFYSLWGRTRFPPYPATALSRPSEPDSRPRAASASSLSNCRRRTPTPRRPRT